MLSCCIEYIISIIFLKNSKCLMFLNTSQDCIYISACPVQDPRLYYRCETDCVIRLCCRCNTDEVPVIFWDETYPPWQRVDTHLHEASLLFSVNAALGLHLPGRFICQGPDQGWSQTSAKPVRREMKQFQKPRPKSFISCISKFSFRTFNRISVLNAIYFWLLQICCPHWPFTNENNVLFK